MQNRRYQQGFINFLPFIIIGIVVVASVGAIFISYKQNEKRVTIPNQEGKESKAEISALQNEVVDLKKENKETEKETTTNNQKNTTPTSTPTPSTSPSPTIANPITRQEIYETCLGKERLRIEETNKRLETEAWQLYPGNTPTDSVLRMLHSNSSYGLDDAAQYCFEKATGIYVNLGTYEYKYIQSTQEQKSTSFSETMRQREICNLVDGVFLDGKCY